MTIAPSVVLHHHLAQQHYVHEVRPRCSSLDVRSALLLAPGAARQSIVEQFGADGLPPDWETMPLARFLQWAAGARPPASSQSPLTVRAFGYRNEQGALVPVRTVRIHESGAYENRHRFFNPARYGVFGPSFDKAETGRTYTVTVEWEDGRVEVVSVLNKGWPVEVW